MEQHPRSPSTRACAGLAVYLIPLTLLGVVACAASWRGVNLGWLMLDPARVTNSPYYLGAFSNLGVAAWAATATICFFVAAAVPDRTAERLPPTFFTYAGGLSLMLMADDMLMVHETASTVLAGFAEFAIFGCYAVLVIGWLWGFRRHFPRTPWLLLASSLGFFAVSVLVDSQTIRGNAALLLEDGAKFTGIVGWLAYFSATALGEVRAALGTASQPLPGHVASLGVRHPENPYLLPEQYHGMADGGDRSSVPAQAIARKQAQAVGASPLG